MLTKEYIKKLKSHNSSDLENLVNSHRSNIGDLVFILENLGYLNSNFNTKWIEELLDYNNEQVRFWAIKNLGKLNNKKYLDKFAKVAFNDESTIVKREAVSSIGRMRHIDAQNILIEMLNNEDPKIVCQAIRGLLVFKGKEKVDKKLEKLIDHENEMVREIIHKEYFKNNQDVQKSNVSHSQVLNSLKNVVVNADVLDVIKLIPNESIHLTFTSPPYYNARDYSIYSSYDAYLKFLEEVFQETFRITKEGRFLIVNTSPIIVPRISRSHSSKRYPIPFDLHNFLVKMDWEFIDDIIWMKPEYSVKNRIGGFQQHRKPLAYKPNSITEYLMVYRKKTDKLLDWNIRQYNNETVYESKVMDGFETTNVWQIPPKSDKIHSAIFPYELCKRVIEYYSYKGDLVFDPFAGSGTLGRTAKKLGRCFFLTEKENKYFEYMKTFQKNSGMFEEDKTKFYTYEQFKDTLL